jgi:hypothetical protein
MCGSEMSLSSHWDLHERKYIKKHNHCNLRKRPSAVILNLNWFDRLQRLISLIVVLGGDTLQHLQRFIQNIKYIILEFTPSTTSFIPFSWFLEHFQQLSFLHLHSHAHIIWTYSTSYSFPHHIPLPLVPNPSPA